MKKNDLAQKVATIAGEVVTAKGYVSVIDLMLGLNWLTNDKLNDWRKGRVPYLEKVIIANLSKISRAMKAFKRWAVHSNLKPSQTVYKHKSFRLQFSKTGNSYIETVYSTHYVLQKPSKKSICKE
jgi:hypothetical protein